MHRFFVSGLFTLALLCFTAARASAEGEGQADLDKATQAKLEAKSLNDLKDVVELCESALKKGLDEKNKAFAQQLLSTTLLQRGTILTSPIFDRQPPSPQWPQLRTLALADLRKAVEADPAALDAYTLIVKLESLPGGDKEKAMQAADGAIKACGDDAEKKSEALTLRALLQEDKEKQLADLNEAIKLDPANENALRRRGLHFIDQENYEQGLEDVMAVLKLNPEDTLAHQAAAEALTRLKKFDEALEHLNKSIDLEKNAGEGYILRARLYAIKGDHEKAVEDLNKALEKNPRNLAALLMRAELRVRLEKFDQAEADVDRVIQLQPALPQAYLMRSRIYAAQEKFSQAIGDLEKLAQVAADDSEIRMQIASLYVADKRPSKAIEVYSSIVEDDKEAWEALRGRGDALLSIGKQAEAIKDYEAAIKIEGESPGLLNNLAWVLSTSPKDELRDGKRAVELATKAAELSEHKAAYILSTLASAYAEAGDFDKAVEWSKKSVEIGSDDLKEQLREELKSYEDKKPWRELQDVKEKPQPEKAEDTDLDL